MKCISARSEETRRNTVTITSVRFGISQKMKEKVLRNVFVFFFF